MGNAMCIPVDVTAYALSKQCAEAGTEASPRSRLAPLTQPNYVGLQLHNALIQHDVLDHIDFHLTAPASNNPRISNLAKQPSELRRNRLGNYIHWSLPRLYRSAQASADSYENKSDKDVRPSGTPTPNPSFRTVPNSWLVVRRLDLGSAQPQGSGLPEYQSWVVESNVVRNIGDIENSADLEVDCVPFVTGSGFEPGKAPDSTRPDGFQMQSETFLGKKSAHAGFDPNVERRWTATASPTVPLTVMNSSNPLFPDYVPHNSNVFSIIDSFRYKKAGNNDWLYLDKANASYFVLGWHSETQDSPLPKTGARLSSRLQSLFLSLNSATNADPAEKQRVSDLLASNDAFDVLCHGAVYNVKYDFNGKPPSKADEAAQKLSATTKMEPVSIGTTPLDGILTFLDAHDADSADDAETIFGQGAHDVVESIVDMASLLYAQDDTYDSKIRAQDLLYTNNFASSSGGSEWHFDGKTSSDKPPLMPNDAQRKTLALLNEQQTKLDAANEKLRETRWELFSEWWQFLSNRANDQNSVISDAKNRVATLKRRAVTLERLVNTITQSIKGPTGTALQNQVPCKQAAKAPFYKRKDPTMCIAGLDSGFAPDFMDVLPIRDEKQIKMPDNKFVQIVKNFMGQATNPLPNKLQSACQTLLAEFINNIAVNVDGKTKGHKQWGNVNPFQPLFIEWEAQYFHIERKKWTVSVRKSPVGQPHSQVRYGLSEPLQAADQKDVRVLSGRVILTPQPVFSIEDAVRQVLDNSGPELEAAGLSKDEVAALRKDNLKALKQLKFISAQLSGLTDHLLTKYEGAHVKPTFRKQGGDVQSMNVAITKCAAIDAPVDGDNRSMVELIGAESGLTPYANLLSFDKYPGVPFKGVTHGQMMFTKLNIIDKFGQAVCVVQPRPARREPKPEDAPASFYPCLSDFLSPDTIGDSSRLNTVFQEPAVNAGQWPLCRFVQFTPAINQEARINASFLNPNTDGPTPSWHETNDDMHESPVFGWLVLNYQDYGLQFFLEDGTFYRQVRVGGPTGTNASSKWLPFDSPSKPSGNAQLDQLINRMTTWKPPPGSSETPATYLQGFFDMINRAIKNMPYAPSDYSAYANAIVGKPLALVNVGWSLELQAPPYKHQNTLGNTPPGNPNDPIEYPEAANLDAYSFPIKLGDAERPFDGMVGYYLHTPQTGTPPSNLPSKRTPNRTSRLTTDWENLYTYFPSSNTSATKPLTPETFPSIRPYYNDPLTTPNLTTSRVDRYLVTTMLIDPYTPIHAYSPILPVKSLRLQPWTMHKAFSRMSAFFRLGPQLLSQDVPAYIENSHLDPDSWNATAAKGASSTTASNTVPAAIRLPISGKKGMWQWLQPYDVPGRKVTEEERKAGKKDEVNSTRFVSMDVGEEDSRIRKEKAPYTFVEGYLQLARPLLGKEMAGILSS
ncbi:hypothetical protein TI39_contig350g00002 [Zymoseptoria brevis]|uniref:Uncharacterized protein n=1 Tax=Zymoseptoria brevis TaxID=1047168 RepID=A0A0F4GS30_9PEZI|nr:hypothetical protein TI39_contig350g00002 [Zymoseptoria brevis]